MTAPACSFCDTLGRLEKLVSPELVWEFPHSVALLGTWQYYHGYCVLVAKTHARELFELPDAERRGYLDEMTVLAHAIARAVSPRKMNYELLGNQVPHLHWHLFPRSADDPRRLAPVWTAIDEAERDEGKKVVLQTGPRERAWTVTRLRQSLVALGAPTA